MTYTSPRDPVRGRTRWKGKQSVATPATVPSETRLLHMRPMRNPGVAWGVDPLMQRSFNAAYRGGKSVKCHPECYLNAMYVYSCHYRLYTL
jgi:hypothetical protein